MKQLIFIITLLVTSKARAMDLHCTPIDTQSHGALEEIGKASGFTIYNFNSAHPELSLDGGTMSFESNESEYVIDGSNQCDNHYSFSMKQRDVKKFLKYGDEGLIGRLSYEDASGVSFKATVECEATEL